MKKYICALLCLLLCGCSALPRPREMENMALLRTLGVDFADGAYKLTASTGPRPDAAGERQNEALVLTGSGTTIEKAVKDLKASSDHTVFLGYVDQLLVGRDLLERDLMPLLDYVVQDEEMSLGTMLWALPDLTAKDAVTSGGEQGVEQRLNTLRLNGARTRTAGEVCADLLDTGGSSIPALSLTDDLLFPERPIHYKGGRT